MNKAQIELAKKKTEEWLEKTRCLEVGIRTMKPPPMSHKYKRKVQELEKKRKLKRVKQDKKQRDKCIKREAYQQQQRTVWNNDYKSYLQSDEWKAKRHKKLQEVEFRCQICTGRQQELHVHHRTYARIFNEKMIDLTVLCRNCHTLFHQQFWSEEKVESEVYGLIEKEFYKK